MNYHSHKKAAAIGATLAAIASYQYEPKTAFPVFLFTFLGGNFPDLDTNSTPSKIAARAGVVLSTAFLWLDLYVSAIIGIIFMLTKTGNHRGWTHSIFLPLLIFIFSHHYGFPLYGLAFGFGIYIHLFLDIKILKKYK